MEDPKSIASNVKAVRQRVERAAVRAGRDPEEITLIAVSKTVGAGQVREAYEAGIRHFGENKAQELVQKRQSLDLECTWHFIGRLQSNKAKDAVKYASLIHSVDSLPLAREIDKRAAALGSTAQVLAQINISAELTKGGIPPEEAEEFVKALEGFKHIKVLGLMTIAQPTSDPEDVRPAFRRMKHMFDRLAASRSEMKHLSMGMSHDFEVAIEEGATMVRVGTAIFGQRVYPAAQG